MKMLLQNLKLPSFIMVFISGTLLWALSILIAIVGPNLYESHNYSSYDCAPGVKEFNRQACGGVKLTDPSTSWIGKVDAVDRLNQRLFLVAWMENKDYKTTAYSKEVEFEILVHGKNRGEADWTEIIGPKDKRVFRTQRTASCNRGNKWCFPLVLAHMQPLSYDSYSFNVSLIDGKEFNFLRDIEFQFITGDANFTVMSLFWRFFFLVMNVFFICLFMFYLKNFKWSDLAHEQKWTALLLFALLLGLNNPLYPLVVLTTSWIPLFYDIVAVVSFTVFILLYWLVIFDGVRTEAEEVSAMSFYAFKVSLMGILWFGLISVLFLEQITYLDTPTRSLFTKDFGTLFLELTVALIVVIYFFWLFFVVMRTLFVSHSVKYLGKRILFFAAFTFGVVLISIGGLIIDILGPVLNTAAQVLPFYSLYNIYVWILVILYLPENRNDVSQNSNNQDIAMSRLDESMAESVSDRKEDKDSMERIELPEENREVDYQVKSKTKASNDESESSEE